MVLILAVQNKITVVYFRINCGQFKTLFDLTGCVDRWSGSARVHHLPLPVNWRSCRAKLRSQCGPTSWCSWSDTTHRLSQGPRAGDHGECQEVARTLIHPDIFFKETLILHVKIRRVMPFWFLWCVHTFYSLCELYLSESDVRNPKSSVSIPVPKWFEYLKVKMHDCYTKLRCGSVMM